MFEYIVKSKEDTRNLAVNIASKVSRGDIITLNGDLGSGKTFFSSCFINYFSLKENRFLENVISPTFNIVKVYNTNNFDIYHFDLYRLNHKEELYELNINDAFDNVSLIEWPDIIKDILPKKIININIKIKSDCRIFFVEFT